MRDDAAYVAAILKMPHVEELSFTMKRDPPSGEPMRLEWRATVRGKVYAECIDISEEPSKSGKVVSPENGARLILVNALHTLEALADDADSQCLAIRPECGKRCELVIGHVGDHLYRGGLDAEFEMLWPSGAVEGSYPR